MDIIQWILMTTSPFVLLFILSQICLVEAPSLWAPVSFWHYPSFFEYFIAFWHKMFLAYLILSPSQAQNQPFLQQVLVIISEE